MPRARQTSGVINGQEVYTLEQFKFRLGVKEAAVRQMRRAGLPVIRIGHRAFISGRQAIEFLEALGYAEDQGAGGQRGTEVPPPAVE